MSTNHPCTDNCPKQTKHGAICLVTEFCSESYAAYTESTAKRCMLLLAR